MRRMMCWMVAVGFMVSLAGCRIMHAHGICDCEEDDHCVTRQPWVQHGTHAAPVAPELIQPPAKLPDAKKKNL